MCMGGGGSQDTGPTAAQLAQQQQQEADHQAQMAAIQADRDRIDAQSQMLVQQQEQFNKAQNDMVAQLAIAAQAAANKTAPAAPLPSGTVSTGADTASGAVTDAQADADTVSRKRGRAALRIDLTSPVVGASGLNIPIG